MDGNNFKYPIESALDDVWSWKKSKRLESHIYRREFAHFDLVVEYSIELQSKLNGLFHAQMFPLSSEYSSKQSSPATALASLWFALLAGQRQRRHNGVGKVSGFLILILQHTCFCKTFYWLTSLLQSTTHRPTFKDQG